MKNKKEAEEFAKERAFRNVKHFNRGEREFAVGYNMALQDMIRFVYEK